MLEVERVSDSFFADSTHPSFANNNSSSKYQSKGLYLPLLSSRPKMPVDFAAYLMSSSPPGFSLYHSFNVNAFNHCNVTIAPLKPIICNSKKESVSFDFGSGSPLKSPTCVCFSCQSDVIQSARMRDNSLFSAEDSGSDDPEDEGVEDLTCKCRSISLEDSADSSESCDISPPDSRRSSVKRVTFADCRGLSLTEVRIMTESSDTPPNLQPQFLSSLTQGALPGVTEIPPLKLDFSQPASDYYCFREKLQRQCVCLENVILKDYTVLGTIKVKNISFEKKVVVRVSFNSWNSYTDIVANYVASGDNSKLLYDTFAFEIHVPSTMDPHQAVEFCVQYHCENGDFWDNNHGRNYRIVTVDYNKTLRSNYTADYRPNFDEVDTWSEYSSWHLIDQSVPYY